VLTEGGDAGQRREVERFDGQAGVGDGGANLLDRGLAFGAITDRHDYVGARRGQPTRQSKPQPAVGSGDDRQLSRQIGHIRD
jgi:hypothetical protein